MRVLYQDFDPTMRPIPETQPPETQVPTPEEETQTSEEQQVESS